MANATHDYQVFLPSTANDLPLSGVSNPMYSTWIGSSGHSRGFDHTGHPYYQEAGPKGKFLVLPSGMRSDQLVNGVQDVVGGNEHTMNARYYMESAHVQFDLSTLYNGSARIWQCSTDDLDMPKTTTVFAPEQGEQDSDIAIRYRRPIPTATAKIAINDLTTAVRSVNLGASQHACFDATVRLCAPSMWKAGGLDTVAPTTSGLYDATEAIIGHFPMANPFAGCATTGFFLVVDAIGADVNLSMAVRMTHFVEHAPRYDTSSSDAQMRSVFLRPSMHSTSSSEETRDAKLVPLALSGHGTTFEESGKCLYLAQKNRTSVGIPPTQIIPSQTKLLAPHPQTALERFEDGAISIAKTVGGFVKTGAEIAKQGVSIFNDVKGILSLF